MRLNSRLTKICVLVLLVLLLAPLFTKSEEDRLKASLQELVELAQLEEGEHPLDSAQKSKRIPDFFILSPTFEFSNAGYDDYQISTKKDLSQKVLLARTRLKNIELGIEDIKIEIKGIKAEVRMIGSALGSLKSQEGQFFDRHRVKVLMEKLESTWLISRVIHLKNLRGNDQSKKD